MNPIAVMSIGITSFSAPGFSRIKAIHDIRKITIAIAGIKGLEGGNTNMNNIKIITQNNWITPMCHLLIFTTSLSFMLKIKLAVIIAARGNMGKI